MLDEDLKSKYDDYYAGQSGWRRVGALDKVAHIEELCGRDYEDVLEVGAGEGSVLARLDEVEFAPNLYGLEISDSGVAAIHARALPRVREARQFDGYTTPYADGQFDLVIATHVLEHVEHERLFLKELRRIGRAVFIEVPLEDHVRIAGSIVNDIGHINFYRRETLLALLKSVRLEPVRWRVFDYSVAVSSYHAGRVKGMARSLVRHALLRATPRLAQHLFTYHLGVLARP